MRIPIGDQETSVEVDGSGDTVFVLAHGAGGDMNARAILKIRDELVARGFRVARFNFLYKELRKSMPDRMPKLMETYATVAAHLRGTLQPKVLICGGHSMGGRTASMLAAEGFAMDGLTCLAYPLHPAGQPEKLRVEHLAKIAVSTLCINGTNDELCTFDLMEKHRPTTSNWTMHWIDRADHSYHVPKSTGRTDKDVMAEIGDTVAAWAKGLG